MELMKKGSEATQTLRAGCSKTDPQTNTQTDRGDYNTLRRLARSVKIACKLACSEVFNVVLAFDFSLYASETRLNCQMQRDVT